MPRCARGAKAGGDAKTGKATEGDIVSEQEEDSFNLIDWSGDLLGSLTGVSVAVLHNDVTGLLTGAAVGPSVAHAFRYGAKLFVSRVLAGREKARVGVVYGLAAHKIKERLDNGEKLRTDGFFEPDITGRSPADEIAEAVLIAAQREHEERKLPYIANLLAFVAFTPGVDRATANQMIRLAGSLSYQQFCLLALGNYPIRASLNQPGYPRGAQSGAPLFAVLNELFELYQSGLASHVSGHDRTYNPSAHRCSRPSFTKSRTRSARPAAIFRYVPWRHTKFGLRGHHQHAKKQLATIEAGESSGSAQGLEWERLDEGRQRAASERFSGGIKVNLDVPDPIEFCGSDLAHAAVFHPPRRCWNG